jgi:hypothetical protein
VCLWGWESIPELAPHPRAGLEEQQPRTAQGECHQPGSRERGTGRPKTQLRALPENTTSQRSGSGVGTECGDKECAFVCAHEGPGYGGLALSHSQSYFSKRGPSEAWGAGQVSSPGKGTEHTQACQPWSRWAAPTPDASEELALVTVAGRSCCHPSPCLVTQSQHAQESLEKASHTVSVFLLRAELYSPSFSDERSDFCFWAAKVDWILKSGFQACRAGTLPLEPHLQSISLWCFWRWGLVSYLPK